MREASTRDGAWFDHAYRRFYEDVMRYSYRRLRDADAAEELAQEVFVIAWRRRQDVPDCALPWLYGVARRLLANEWRSRRLRPISLSLDEAEGLPHVQSRDEGLAAVMDVERAMKSMLEGDREILSLVAWEQLSITEVARALDCTTVAASVRLFRARRRLLALLRIESSSNIQIMPQVEGDSVACSQRTSGTVDLG